MLAVARAARAPQNLLRRPSVVAAPQHESTRNRMFTLAAALGRDCYVQQTRVDWVDQQSPEWAAERSKLQDEDVRDLYGLRDEL